MLHDALELHRRARWPSAGRRPRPARSRPSEVGHGLHGRRLRQGDDLCIIAVGKMLDAAEAAADRLDADGVSVTVWDARVVKPLDPEMLADAARHPCVLTVEDGLREGGVGSADRRPARRAHASGGHEPRVRVLGHAVAYLPHGKPDAILAELGLDAAGITAVGDQPAGTATTAARDLTRRSRPARA